MFFLAQRRLFPSFQLFSEGNQFSRKCCKECKPPDRRRWGACKLALCMKGRQSMTRISKHISTMESRRFSSLLSSLRTEHFFPPWKITSLLPSSPHIHPTLPCKVMKTISSIFSLLSSAGCATHSSPLPRTADFCRVDELRFYKRKLRGDNVVLFVKNRERHRVFLSHFHAFPLSELSASSESEWKVGSFLCCFPKSSFIQFSSLAHQRKESVLIKRLFLRLRGVRSSLQRSFYLLFAVLNENFNRVHLFRVVFGPSRLGLIVISLSLK